MKIVLARIIQFIITVIILCKLILVRLKKTIIVLGWETKKRLTKNSQSKVTKGASFRLSI
jgi:hypothetical protein